MISVFVCGSMHFRRRENLSDRWKESERKREHICNTFCTNVELYDFITDDNSMHLPSIHQRINWWLNVKPVSMQFLDVCFSFFHSVTVENLFIRISVCIPLATRFLSSFTFFSFSISFCCMISLRILQFSNYHHAISCTQIDRITEHTAKLSIASL